MSKHKPPDWHIAAIKAKTVQVGSCWVWQGFVTRGGYGQREYRGKSARVHRLMYELTHGIDLPDNEHVCHSCDVRLCCNPDHLWVGDNRANALDMVSKDRLYTVHKTHCPRGHSYDEYGYTPPGKKGRSCIVCMRARQRIRAGWPEHLAFEPKVRKGQRPVNADFKSARAPKPRTRVYCKRGHKLDGANVYISPSGNRQCALCKRAKRDEHAARARAAYHPPEAT